MSFETICRICINENPEMVSIFASYNFQKRYCEIFKVITNCASVQVEKCDGFSQQICLRCLDQLSQAYRFKKLCEDSDYKFRNNLVAIETKTEFCKVDTYEENHNYFKEDSDGKSYTANFGLTEVKRKQYNDKRRIENTTDKDQDEIQKEEIFLRSKESDHNRLMNNLILTDEIEIKSEFTEEENTANTYDEANKETEDYGLNEVKREQCDDEIIIQHEKFEVLVEDSAHSSNVKAPYKCNFCQKEFTFKSRLVNHVKSHTGEKAYKCDLCEKTFRERANLTNHLRMHTGERPYECEYCEKKFTKSSNLTEHIRMHTGEKPYKCEFCGKAFTRRTGLTIHIRVHTGEKNYKCEFCEKRFADGSSLVAHTRLHLGEKAFKCDVCEKTFTQSGHLAIHLRMHTGEKPFKCDVCERHFAQKSGLTKHIRIHTGEKPFKCEFCEKRFAGGGNLAIHINRMHTEDK